jgi:hypothetical protein
VPQGIDNLPTYPDAALMAACGPKITFGESGVLIYCADYHCSQSVALNADRWPSLGLGA